MMRWGPGGMPIWCAPRPGPRSVTDGPGDRGVGCYLMVRPLPLPLAAPAEVILLVFISSPIYLHTVSLCGVGDGVENLRLKKLISAFQLLVFRLDDLDTIYNLQQTRLEGFGLPDEGSQSQARRACVGDKQWDNARGCRPATAPTCTVM